MRETPIILSIITVCYNAEKTIKGTIESINNQSWPYFEYIIIDGQSEDGTLDLVNSYATQISKVVSEPDRGIYDAMNKGLDLAIGEYVLFINAGDQLMSKDTLANIFTVGHGADIYYGETVIIDEKGTILGTRTELTSRKLPAQLKLKDFLQGQVVSHQSFIVRRSLVSKYNTNYKCSADIDWMLGAVSRASDVQHCEITISKYQEGGFSDRRPWLCWWERFLVMLKYFSLHLVVLHHIGFMIRFSRNKRFFRK